jgi:hypothetical protein
MESLIVTVMVLLLGCATWVVGALVYVIAQAAPWVLFIPLGALLLWGAGHLVMKKFKFFGKMFG